MLQWVRHRDPVPQRFTPRRAQAGEKPRAAAGTGVRELDARF